MSLSIGDKVRVNDNPRIPPSGLEGEVVFIHEGGDVDLPILVEFGGAWGGGHTGGPEYDGRDCFWMSEDQLELVASARPKQFYLVGLFPKRLGEEGFDTITLTDEPTFYTGKEAAEYAQRVMRTNAYGAHKIQPRRFSQDDGSWRQRELNRIEDETYIRLPKSWDLEPIPDHFLHMSRDEPTKLAYTESLEKGVLDRQTRVTPGRYLERFYPHLSDQDKKRYVAMIDKPEEVLFAKTPDEIERVYRRGPGSCMSHAPADYAGEEHPVRAYGDSDIQVAYLERDRRITARAVCWPEKKIFGRLYGDEARLSHGLEGMGYKFGSLEGARIRKVRDHDSERYIVPYLDHIGRAHDPDPDDMEGWLILKSDGNVASNAEGLATTLLFCPKMGRWEVGPLRLVRGVEEEWSNIAISNYAVRVDRNGLSEYWDSDYVIHIDGRGYLPKAEVQHLIVKSAFSGKEHLKTDMVELADGRFISHEELRYHGFTCAGNGKRYLKSEGYKLINARLYSNSYLESLPEDERPKEKMRKLSSFSDIATIDAAYDHFDYQRNLMREMRRLRDRERTDVVTDNIYGRPVTIRF